jgi:hypothetical protein
MKYFILSPEGGYIVSLVRAVFNGCTAISVCGAAFVDVGAYGVADLTISAGP